MGMPTGSRDRSGVRKNLEGRTLKGRGRETWERGRGNIRKGEQKASKGKP